MLKTKYGASYKKLKESILKDYLLFVHIYPINGLAVAQEDMKQFCEQAESVYQEDAMKHLLNGVYLGLLKSYDLSDIFSGIDPLVTKIREEIYVPYIKKFEEDCGALKKNRLLGMTFDADLNRWCNANSWVEAYMPEHLEKKVS